jgi:hypothetical protein
MHPEHPAILRLAQNLYDMHVQVYENAKASMGHRVQPHELGCGCDDCRLMQSYNMSYGLPWEQLEPHQKEHYVHLAQEQVLVLAPYFTQVHTEAISGSIERARELAKPLRVQLSEEQLIKLKLAIDKARSSPAGHIILTSEALYDPDRDAPEMKYGDPPTDPGPYKEMPLSQKRVCHTVYGPGCDDKPMYACWGCGELQHTPFSRCPNCGYPESGWRR